MCGGDFIVEQCSWWDIQNSSQQGSNPGRVVRPLPLATTALAARSPVFVILSIDHVYTYVLIWCMVFINEVERKKLYFKYIVLPRYFNKYTLLITCFTSMIMKHNFGSNYIEVIADWNFFLLFSIEEAVRTKGHDHRIRLLQRAVVRNYGVERVLAQEGMTVS
jgi:hypothetical protein